MKEQFELMAELEIRLNKAKFAMNRISCIIETYSSFYPDDEKVIGIKERIEKEISEAE